MAAEEEFVGRPRPLWKILVYSIVSFGVYGRVYLYKTAKELDGHAVYFLNLDWYRILLILPVGGPLAVKFRLVQILERVIRHDVAAKPLPKAILRVLAFVPWIPAYHAVFQLHVDEHWALHRRLADVEALRSVIAAKKTTAKSKTALTELAQLEADLKEHEEAIALARDAAIAIREANRARAKAEREARADSRSAGLSLSFLRRKREPITEPVADPEPARVEPKLSRKERKASQKAAEPAPKEAEPVVQAAEPSRKERKAAKKAAKEAEKAAKRAEKEAAKTSAPESPPVSAPEASPKRRFSLFGKNPPAREDPAPARPEPAPPAHEAEPVAAPAPKRAKKAPARRKARA